MSPMDESDDDLPTLPPTDVAEGPTPAAPGSPALPLTSQAPIPGAAVTASPEPESEAETGMVPTPVVPTPEPAPVSVRAAPPSSLQQNLTAARDAKAFVARLFAEVHAAEEAQADATDATDAAAPADSTPAGRANGDVAANIVMTAASASGSPDASMPVPEVSSDPDTGDEPTGTPSEPGLQGVTVLILGLGVSGLAMARWCVREGAQVTVADTREAPPQLATLQADCPGVRFCAGAFDAQLVDGAGRGAVFRSPGLTPVQVAPVFDAARARGWWCGGELDLFAHALRMLAAERGYRPQVLAVTGTNGKTTTTALAGRLVEQAGRTVAVAGNIGPTLLDTLAAALHAPVLPDVWVLELSSFQLDGVQGFEPSAAVVLNLTQDHLDWHGDMAAYGAAKARIFGAQGLIVLNRDDPQVMAMLPEPVRVKLQKPRYRSYITFGADLPQRPGDFGLETVNGMTWLVRAQEADETQKRRRGEEEEIFIQRLMPADALRIRGRHNATNALAALALAQAIGCPLNATLYALREYSGEPHRVEPVATIRDVEYFDDSKGTNVGATVAALNGLGPDRRLVVILGGDGKGQDFAPLFAPVQRHVRAAVLIGRDAAAIRAAVQGTGVTLRDAATLPEAVQIASTLAQAGDAVLLSPACASLDMFSNYEHRARVFINAVQALSDAGGWA